MERYEAIVAGAGPAGLAAAAVLEATGFAVLVIERGPAVGMRWRERYEGLRLNTMRVFSTLPGHRFARSSRPLPATRGPRRVSGNASHHGSRSRSEPELRQEVEAADDGDWRLETLRSATSSPLRGGCDRLRRAATRSRLARARQLRRRLDPRRRLPQSCGLPRTGLLIVGAGNTGIDIAGHLLDAGARVTVAMRTPPNIFPRDWGPFPLQPLAIVGEKQPAKMSDALGFLMQRSIFGNLARHGIPRAPEGYESRFRHTLTGPAVDDGFVAALKAGRTRVTAPIDRFDEREVVLADGTRLNPDTVICATGYRRGLEPIVGHLGVLRPDGLPVRYKGAPELPAAPRLYFAGFWGGTGGQLRWASIIGARIGRAAARDRKEPGAVSRPERASSSIGWSTGSARPRRSVCAVICSAQPGLAGGDRLGARVEQVARLALAQLGRGLGLDQVVDPRRAAAELPLAGSSSSSPGMPRSSSRGCSRTPCAWARWQASW